MLYPDIDPVALDLGLLKVRWYGLMYLAVSAAACAASAAATAAAAWLTMDGNPSVRMKLVPS